jgi:hypothetical protein
MNLITIENNGPEIVSSNYWTSEYSAKGYVYLSINASAFRLLIPDNMKIDGTLLAKEVIVSRGTWPDQGRADALELLFEDYSDSPFCLHIGTEQVDRMPADTDRNKSFIFSVWTFAGKILEVPARYRIVKKIPYLKPWKVSH